MFGQGYKFELHAQVGEGAHVRSISGFTILLLLLHHGVLNVPNKRNEPSSQSEQQASAATALTSKTRVRFTAVVAIQNDPTL